jgi:hypothetical protein
MHENMNIIKEVAQKTLCKSALNLKNIGQIFRRFLNMSFLMSLMLTTAAFS